MTEDGALPTVEATGDTPPAPTLLQAAAAYAMELARLGVHETSHNSSDDIDRWLAQVHARPGDPWCAATAFEIFRYASLAVGVKNPCPQSASAMRMYALCEDRWTIGAGVMRSDPGLMHPGLLFFEDHDGAQDGQGKGHVGICLGWTATGLDLVDCISGNAAPGDSHSREGVAVVRQNRPISRMLAFADFSRA